MRTKVYDREGHPFLYRFFFGIDKDGNEYKRQTFTDYFRLIVDLPLVVVEQGLEKMIELISCGGEKEEKTDGGLI